MITGVRTEALLLSVKSKGLLYPCVTPWWYLLEVTAWMDALYGVVCQYLSGLLLGDPSCPLWYGAMHEMIPEKAAGWFRTLYRDFKFWNLSEPLRTALYELRSKFKTKFGNNATAFELMVYLQEMDFIDWEMAERGPSADARGTRDWCAATGWDNRFFYYDPFCKQVLSRREAQEHRRVGYEMGRDGNKCQG